MNMILATKTLGFVIDKSPIGFAILIIGILGSICIASFSIPGLIKVLKTNDTTWVSISMYVILTSGSLCFMISGILAMANNLNATFVSLIGVTCANVLSFIIALIVLLIKLHNVSKAKKLGISEAEYCKKSGSKSKSKK